MALVGWADGIAFLPFGDLGYFVYIHPDHFSWGHGLVRIWLGSNCLHALRKA